MSKTNELDQLRRRAEQLRKRREMREAIGHVSPVTCRHFVSRRGVEDLRRLGGGVLPCVKCGAMLRISGTVRVLDNGEIL
jgi:hypothetical protein